MNNILLDRKGSVDICTGIKIDSCFLYSIYSTMEAIDNTDYMEMPLFYQKLIEEYKNDTYKFECMLSYLAKDESFATEYVYMDKRDLIFRVQNASYYCDSSVISSPLGIAIITSVTCVTLAIVGIKIYRMLTK
jgi:hypothetical protein